MRQVSASEKVAPPAQSIAADSAARVSRSDREPKNSAITATPAGAANTARHPAASISTPARSGPNANPTPNVVPSRLKARARVDPVTSCARAAVPPARAPAAPTPCTARSRSIQPSVGARASSTEAIANKPTPVMNTRLRPQRSARAPAVMSRPPKVSMKAFVIQASPGRSPPSKRPIAGVTTAPPEKLIGRIRAAAHTAAEAAWVRVGLWECVVINGYLRSPS